MNRLAFALDLVDDEKLIAEYEAYHQHIWPEIRASIIDAGILNMEIYRISDRLFMIIEVCEDFSFDYKAQSDAVNPLVQEWEGLMWKYQKSLPVAKESEKWVLMNKIFVL